MADLKTYLNAVARATELGERLRTVEPGSAEKESIMGELGELDKIISEELIQ